MKTIDPTKKYITRTGNPVRIIASDFKGPNTYCIIAVITSTDSDFEEIATYTADGHYYQNKQYSGYDLIEDSPYKDFKIDDKVFVWEDNSYKRKRYFAGVSEKTGKVLCYDGGSTSWSNPTNVTEWTYCEKAI